MSLPLLPVAPYLRGPLLSPFLSHVSALSYQLNSPGWQLLSSLCIHLSLSSERIRWAVLVEGIEETCLLCQVSCSGPWLLSQELTSWVFQTVPHNFPTSPGHLHTGSFRPQSWPPGCLCGTCGFPSQSRKSILSWGLRHLQPEQMGCLLNRLRNSDLLGLLGII